MKYYYETNDDAVENDLPLKYVIYESGVDDDVMFCWTYNEEGAKLLVKALNQFSSPISALAFKVSEIIDKDLQELDHERRDLQAKILYHSNQLTGEQRQVFDSFFQIKRIKHI